MFPLQYNKLRPFDPDAVLRGAPFCDEEGNPLYPVEGNISSGPDTWPVSFKRGCSSGTFFKMRSELRMAPVAWLHGLPAYKGDVVYDQYLGKSYIQGVSESESYLRLSSEIEGSWGLFKAEHLSWQPFNIKKSGWFILDVTKVNDSFDQAEKLKEELISQGAVPGDLHLIEYQWSEPNPEQKNVQEKPVRVQTLVVLNPNG